MNAEAEHRPEADRLTGAPHPREAERLFGHATAENAFLRAHADGRLHHAWLISGPRGIGKATLAWRIARFLLAQPVKNDAGLFGDAAPQPTDLQIDLSHPVARRLRAGSEPGLFLLRRGYDEKSKKLRQAITVDEARGLRGFFGLSATEGGWRIVIVDAVDEMNVNAANALLKILEEPPKNAMLLLVAHQPARLLPTIRSRCRNLRLAPLAPDALSDALRQAAVDPDDITPGLMALCEGSAGTAVRLVAQEGAALYANLVALMHPFPKLDRMKIMAFSESMRGTQGLDRLDLTITLLDHFLSRLARSGAGVPLAGEAAPGEAALFARLAPDAHAARAWANAAEISGAKLRHGRAVNLDPGALILDTLLGLSSHVSHIAS